MEAPSESSPERLCFNLVMQNASGTDYVHYLGIHILTADNDISSGRSAEDVNDELGAITDTSGTVGLDPYNSSGAIGSGVSDGSTIYVLYSATDQDLYLVTTDDNAATWETETEILDAVSVNYISAGILDTGKIAYFYEDNGTLKYNEYTTVSGEVITLIGGSLTRS